MNKAISITNTPEGTPQDELNQHLKKIQKVSGKYNMIITGAVVDRSNGEMPYINETFEVLEEQLITDRFDVIILDDTFDYEMSEAYVLLSEWADANNISIFHFEEDDLYMPDSNEKFDYADVPFEVCQKHFTW